MYTFYEDAGHGWLKVRLSELEALRIDVYISRYSYVKGGYVYLEEDMDMGTFIKALKIGDLRSWFDMNVTTRLSNRSRVRSYESYVADMGKLKRMLDIPAESEEVDIDPYRAKVTCSELAMHTNQAGKSVRRLWKHPTAEYGYALMYDHSFLHGCLGIHSDGSISLS